MTSRFGLARIFGNAVLGQAILSAANLSVGILLIRYAHDEQYGYFVLITAGLMLLGSLQNAFLAPQLVDRLTQLQPALHGVLTGGVYRSQLRLVSIIGLMVMAASLLLWLLGLLDSEQALLLGVTALAALSVMRRNFLRMLLLAYHRAHDALRADVVYAFLLVSSVLVALVLPSVAAAAVGGLGLAALAGGALLLRGLQRHRPLDLSAPHVALYHWIPLGAWSAAGAAVHWSFAQGYNYLVAGVLDVASVAAIAAVRLVVMPVVLLSAGVGPLMLPLASRWLRQEGPQLAWRRLQVAALSLAMVASLYLVIAWMLQDWIFLHLLHKDFEQRELMLAGWSVALLLMVVRDQMMYLLVASQRFRTLMALASFCAVVSLAISFAAMPVFGPAGAVLGVLAGEVLSLLGTIILSWRECATSVFNPSAEICHDRP